MVVSLFEQFKVLRSINFAATCKWFISLPSCLQGEDIIALMPWDEWWDFELNEDDSNPHIALLPLHPDVRAKFNETAAWEYARSMAGKPYGYHNMIFSWIDTLNGNYPPPLDANVVLIKSSILLKFAVQFCFNIGCNTLKLLPFKFQSLALLTSLFINNLNFFQAENQSKHNIDLAEIQHEFFLWKLFK